MEGDLLPQQPRHLHQPRVLGGGHSGQGEAGHALGGVRPEGVTVRDIHLKLDDDIYQWMAMCRRKKKTAMRKRTLSTRRQVAWRCHAPAPPSTTATTSTSSEVRQHEMEMLITWC